MGPNIHRPDRRVLATRFGMVTRTARGDEPVTVTLVYRHAMPFAVTAIFSLPGSSPVSWVFDRELLSSGLAGAAGLGDIRIHREGAEFVVELHSIGHAARIEGPADTALAFVRDIFTAVPIGAENTYFSFDAELAELLANESVAAAEKGSDTGAISVEVGVEPVQKSSPSVVGPRPRKPRFRRD